MARPRFPIIPMRVFGDVTYEDGTPAANVVINFVGETTKQIVATDLTNDAGFYDVDEPPGLETNIPQSETDTELRIFVGDWGSGIVFTWESGASDRYDVPNVPRTAVPGCNVFGDVTHEDGTPAAGVVVNFVNDAGEIVASDLTDSAGHYDTATRPGLQWDIPEPADKTLNLYVEDWDSGKVLIWESGKSERIDITGVPAPVKPRCNVYGEVWYEDQTEGAYLTVNFVDGAGNTVASDQTGGDGHYDTGSPPGLQEDIPEPVDKTLRLFVEDWDSGKVLIWEPGKSERIVITGVPKELPPPPPSPPPLGIWEWVKKHKYILLAVGGFSLVLLASRGS